MDEPLRRATRGGVVTPQALAALMRSGIIERYNVQLAAYLGYQPAVQLDLEALNLAPLPSTNVMNDHISFSRFYEQQDPDHRQIYLVMLSLLQTQDSESYIIFADALEFVVSQLQPSLSDGLANAMRRAFTDFVQFIRHAPQPNLEVPADEIEAFEAWCHEYDPEWADEQTGAELIRAVTEAASLIGDALWELHGDAWTAGERAAHRLAHGFGLLEQQLSQESWEQLRQLVIERLLPPLRDNPRNCGRCGSPDHDRRRCPLKRDAPRKKVFLYVPLPHQLAIQFPERKYPPHITLLHIGDLTRSQWKTILPTIDQILESTQPFELAMTEFGVFAPKYGDFIYPHMRVDSTGLEALHHRLRKAIRDLGITVKHYGFTPHATLDKVDRDEIYVGPRPTGVWTVQHITLIGFEDYTYELGKPEESETEGRQVIIMRGIPGAGKTTYLREHYPGAEVVSADDFHTRHGVYRYRPDKAWLAHKLCYDNYIALLDAGMPLVAVDNTNITKSEIKRYWDSAVERGYQPLLITVIEDPEEALRVGIHNVPRREVLKMARKLEVTKIPGEWDHLIVDYT